MPVFEAFRLALEQLRVQKLKSFFTLLGVMVGVMFLIAVVSIIEGASSYMEHDLVGKLMAVNSFEVRRRPALNIGEMDQQRWEEYSKRPRLYEHDTIAVVNALPSGFRHAVMSRGSLMVSSQYGRPRQVEVINTTSEYFAIKNLGVTNGRVFSQQDDATNARVIVIGQDVQDHFFPGLDPIDRELRIGGIPYRVIGVAEKQGSTFGLSLDRFIIAPYGSPVKRLTNTERGVLDAIIVQAPNATALIEGQEAVRQALRSHRKLRPGQKDNFSIESSESALEFWNKIKGYLVIAGIALPAIGLVVGAIVIMNIMLVAVAERTREIGIRKSLGARQRDILAQFLVEAATLSTLGAALGVAGGAVLALAVATLSPLPTTVAPWSVVVSVVLGAGVGIVAGVYPASRAAKLDPISALRAE
jgi:putative ABC transport system permease protein